MSVLATALNVPAIADELPNWIKHQPSGINFTDFAPSPDGKTIAFEYMDRSLGRNYLGLGLYNWQTGILKRIPNPPGKQLSEPSFSEDGKKLVMAIGNVGGPSPNQIGIINLIDLSTSIITEEKSKQHYPVFQPGTGNILYAYTTQYLFNGLSLLNPLTKTEQIIIDEKNGFTNTMRPNFIGQNEIIFQASGPVEMYLRSEAIKFGGFSAAYYLKFGDKPQFFSLAQEQRARKVIGNAGGLDSLSTSQTGNFVSYINAVPSDAKDDSKILREIFKFENGQPLQLTNYNSTILRARTSDDGSIVAFVADITTPYKFDLCLFKVATAQTITTTVLDQITNNPAFALQ